MVNTQYLIYSSCLRKLFVRETLNASIRTLLVQFFCWRKLIRSRWLTPSPTHHTRATKSTFDAMLWCIIWRSTSRFWSDLRIEPKMPYISACNLLSDIFSRVMLGVSLTGDYCDWSFGAHFTPQIYRASPALTICIKTTDMVAFVKGRLASLTCFLFFLSNLCKIIQECWTMGSAPKYALNGSLIPSDVVEIVGIWKPLKRLINFALTSIKNMYTVNDR